MNHLSILIMAAGKGTRLKSSLPKVLHQLAGIPLIEYVLQAARQLAPEAIGIVVGHESSRVKAELETYTVHFIEQVPQLGTGHAVQLARPFWESRQGALLVLSGDVPLITPATLQGLVNAQQNSSAEATMLTTILADPSGYGRVIRNSSGTVQQIVEEKDAQPEELTVREINTGIYCFEIPALSSVIGDLSSANAQKEYYLTDCIGLLRSKGHEVNAVICEDPAEVTGINSRVELAELERILRERKNRQLMLDGVTLVDPATTYVAPDVVIGGDTVLHPNVYIETGSRVGSHCEIHSNVRIRRSVLEDNVVVLDSCLINYSHIQAGSQIGPFAHFRTQVQVGKGVRIGNFVELKKTEVGDGTKASHLSYLGDTQIGRDVNIGAGTITCNYDGVQKHRTVIEDNVFIGSDSQLIAPVTIHRGAFVAAGSSITQEVPEDSLAIARAQQVIKKNWAKKRRDSLKDK